MPHDIVDNGSKHAWSVSLYAQDEWKVFSEFLTVNYGLRYDYNILAFFEWGSIQSAHQRGLDADRDGTIIHAGYSRYFTPPPIELVANKDIALFANTTSAPSCTDDNTPIAERADYYDVGMEQKIGDAWTVGLDSFFDILNAFDEVYEIRDGTGIGVGAPQFGPGVASFLDCRNPI